MTLHQIWQDLLPEPCDDSKPKAQRLSYYRKVLKLLEDRHPEIVTGEPNPCLDVEQAEALVEKLKKNAPGHVLLFQVRFLAKGLIRGKQEYGWDVVIPPIPVIVRRETGPFPSDIATYFDLAHSAEMDFLSTISDPFPGDRRARIGRLLQSAILFGGVVENRWLRPWLYALPKVQATKDYLWLDMELEFNVGPKKRRSTETKKLPRAHIRTRRYLRRSWKADPITRALIQKWLKEHPGDLMGTFADLNPMAALREFYRANPGKFRWSQNLSPVNLVEAAGIRICERVSPFLAAYANGWTKSFSVPPHVWARLVTDQALSGFEAISLGKSTPEDYTVIEVPTSPSAKREDQEAIYDQIMKANFPVGINWNANGTKIRENLEASLKNPCNQMLPALALLITWAVDLLTEYRSSELIRGRTKGRIRATTMRRYLVSIARNLITVAEDAPLLELDPDELHDIYRDTIDLCRSLEAKSYCACTLKIFHLFLVQRCKADEVDFSDLGVDTGPKELGVNANLLSYNEFERVLSVLAPSYPDTTRMGKMRYLIAVLGFRCGLRRTEARKFLMKDFQGRAKPELLIRNNRYAYTKTGESVRSIPLRALLTEEELQLLLEWRQRRHEEDGDHFEENLLFCPLGRSKELLPEKEVFDIIHLAMRQVTGDPTLRYHHLRHSFATWLTVRLCNIFGENVRKQFTFLRHPFFSGESCQRLRENLLGANILGRPILYAVAKLCGHASPEVTLLHYVHLCDWLLAMELSQEEIEPALEGTTVMSLTKLSRHKVYYQPKPKVEDQPSQGEAEIPSPRHKSNPGFRLSSYLHRLTPAVSAFKDFTLVPADLTPIFEEFSPARTGSMPDYAVVEMVLRNIRVGQRSISEIAISHDLDATEVSGWQKRVQSIAGMVTTRGGFRHINAASFRKNPDLPFPKPLRDTKDRQMADRIFSKAKGIPQDDMTEIRWGLGYFVSRFLASRSGVSCEYPDQAGRFVRFLRKLGVSWQEIKFRMCVPKDFSGSGEDYLKQMANQWPFPAECLALRPFHPSETSAGAWIQVSNQAASKGKNPKSSYGFRYAMYLLAIIYGFDQGPL